MIREEIFGKEIDQNQISLGLHSRKFLFSPSSIQFDDFGSSKYLRVVYYVQDKQLFTKAIIISQYIPFSSVLNVYLILLMHTEVFPIEERLYTSFSELL